VVDLSFKEIEEALGQIQSAPNRDD